MRIIPVMDLLRGTVVHAIGGEREEYQPVRSILTKVPNALSIALAFQNLGLDELYIADLDAICQKGDNRDLIGRMASRSRMEIMVDAGFRRAREIRGYIEEGIRKIVAATETLESFEEASKMKDASGVSVVASIDLKFGRVVAGSEKMQLSLKELIAGFETAGASEIILLSLDRVGIAQGPDLKSLESALECSTIPVLVGGGVRSIADVQLLQKRGAAGALVATALHTGTIKRSDLNRLGTKRSHG